MTRTPEEIVAEVSAEWKKDDLGPHDNVDLWAIECIEADRRERAAAKPPVPGCLAKDLHMYEQHIHLSQSAEGFAYWTGVCAGIRLVIAREFDASAEAVEAEAP